MKGKKWIALLLAAVMMLAVTGCGGKDEGDGEIDRDQVAASIDDVEITSGRLEDFLNLSAYISQRDLSTLKEQPELMTIIRKGMLVNMVGYEAMRMEVEETKEEVFPEDYEDKLKEFLESMKEPGKEMNISEDTLKYYFSLTYYVEPFNKEAQEAVTDADLKAYYDEHISDLYTTTAARGTVSHILVSDESTANEVYDKIAGGADFAEMAKEYGTDGTKDIGGVLGTLDENDPGYDADFMKGAFALKSGEVSKPVKTQFGYHIIKMEDREEAGAAIPFSDEAESIRSVLISQKYSDIVTGLVNKHKVEYFGEFADDPAGGEDGADDNSGGAEGDGGQDGAGDAAE